MLLTLLAIPFLAQQAAFTLGLSANGTGNGTLYRGEPLLVEAVLVFASDGPSITIAQPGNQPWIAGLELTLRDAEGNPVEPLDWTRIGPAAPKVEFNLPLSRISTVLVLEPEKFDALAPGDYRLEAAFSSPQVPRLKAMTLLLQVSAGSRPPEEDGLVKERLFAQWELLRDNPQAALEWLDTALARAPDDLPALSDKVSVLIELNRQAEARQLLDHAIKLFYERFPDDPHPPRDLLAKMRLLRGF